MTERKFHISRDPKVAEQISERADALTTQGVALNPLGFGWSHPGRQSLMRELDLLSLPLKVCEAVELRRRELSELKVKINHQVLRQRLPTGDQTVTTELRYTLYHCRACSETRLLTAACTRRVEHVPRRVACLDVFRAVPCDFHGQFKLDMAMAYAGVQIICPDVDRLIVEYAYGRVPPPPLNPKNGYEKPAGMAIRKEGPPGGPPLA